MADPSSTSFSISKSRFAYFDKAAKKQGGRRRFIAATSLYTDNILKFKGRYLTQKNLTKNYQFTFEGETLINGGDCYVISFEKINDSLKGHQSGTLHIDKETYGVARLDIGTSWQIVYFKYEGHKWYLDFGYSKKVCPQFWDFPSIQIRETQYKRIDTVPEQSKFITKSILAPEFVDKFTGRFNDPYWDEHPFIPLPTWIQQIIEFSGEMKP